MSKAKHEVLRRMADEFAANCVSALEMESIEDYVNIVTVKDYETELKVVLTDQCAAAKDSPFMLARARSARRAGQGEPVEDLDLDCALEHSHPREPHAMAQLEATYQVSLDIRWMLADTLLGRVVVCASASCPWSSQPPE